MNWIWIFAAFLLLLAAWYFLVGRSGRRSDTPDRGKATLMLREEQLKLTKTRERLADVTTHNEVSRELKMVTVPVTKEEFVVEKNGVEAARIPIREDRVEVSTRSVPLNEVSVYETEWEENKEIQAVLKKEVARVKTTGHAPYSEETTAGEEGQSPG